MNKKILLLLTLLLVTTMIQAQVPKAAQVSVRNQAESDTTEVSIVRLERIKMCLNPQNQVQAIFVFEDKADMVFDDVKVISFLAGKDTAQISGDEVMSFQTAASPSIDIYPNPAADMIHISGMEKNSRGEVITLNGQRVCEFDSQSTTMDISGWANGTYLIRVDNQIFKLIKQ